MAESIRISGLRELQAALLKLPEKLTEQVLTGSLLKGARLVVNEAKQRVPVRTGELRRNIRARSDRKRKGKYAAMVIVGVRKLSKKQLAKLRSRKGRENSSDPFYWRFVEFGTSRMHARPFLRPGFEAKKVEAAQVITNDIRARVEKEATLLGRLR